MERTLSIDTEACGGAALCVAMRPALFRLDDAGYSVALKSALSTEEEIEAAQDVADCCPSQAVLLVPGGGGA